MDRPFFERSHAASGGAVSARSLALADHELRRAASGVADARGALAVAEARHARTRRHHEGLLSQIGDLETRAREALRIDRPDLARRAAMTIVGLEADAQRLHPSIADTDQRLDALRDHVRNQIARLVALRHKRDALSVELALAQTSGATDLIAPAEDVLIEIEARLRTTAPELKDVLACLSAFESAGIGGDRPDGAVEAVLLRLQAPAKAANSEADTH
jgi:chromosome segregation ATPase